MKTPINTTVAGEVQASTRKHTHPYSLQHWGCWACAVSRHVVPNHHNHTQHKRALVRLQAPHQDSEEVLVVAFQRTLSDSDTRTKGLEAPFFEFECSVAWEGIILPRQDLNKLGKWKRFLAWQHQEKMLLQAESDNTVRTRWAAFSLSPTVKKMSAMINQIQSLPSRSQKSN